MIKIILLEMKSFPIPTKAIEIKKFSEHVVHVKGKSIPIRMYGVYVSSFIICAKL